MGITAFPALQAEPTEHIYLGLPAGFPPFLQLQPHPNRASP